MKRQKGGLFVLPKEKLKNQKRKGLQKLLGKGKLYRLKIPGTSGMCKD